MCRAMCSLFRENLNLPVEEEMDNHLYKNVTRDYSNDDSDSDTSLSPLSAALTDPLAQKMLQKEKPPTATSALVKEPAGRPEKSPTPYGAQAVSDKTRPSQISQTSTNVNASFDNDLIDFSDDVSAGNSSKSLPKMTAPRTGKQIGVNTAMLSGFGPAKFPLKKQVSCDEYVVPNQPRSPIECSETSDYVIVPPKDANNEAKGKGSSLNKMKFPFISKKTEAKGHPLENIGFGVRLPKPKGPRHPPKSWAVRS